MLNILEIINSLKFSLTLLFISYLIIIINWNSIFNKFELIKYKNPQRVHLNEVPRFGGFLTITIYFFYNIFIDVNNNNFFIILLLSFLPTFVVSFKEDLFNNTKPFTRIVVMILSILIFFLLDSTKFPVIDLPILNQILQNDFMVYSFFIFSALVVMNGNNMIDGSNGLMSLTVLIQLIGIFYLSVQVGDLKIQHYSLFIFFPVVIFLIFNYPLGKIFMGDLGAFFLGFYNSILVLKLFGEYPEIPSWNAVLILFYPSIEVLYSFYRKLFLGKVNPMLADNKHLHTIIFWYGVKKNIDKKKMNNLVLLFLSPFWLSPILVIKFYNNINLIYLSLFFLTLSYFVTYALVKKKLNDIN